MKDSPIVNLDLPFTFESQPGVFYRHLKDGEKIVGGDVVIYSSEVTSVKDGVNIIGGEGVEPYLTVSIGVTVCKSCDPLRYLRKIEEVEPLYHVDGHPEVLYRKLKVGEKICKEDICWTKDALSGTFAEQRAIGGRVLAYSSDGITVTEDQGNFYFRQVDPPPAAPLPASEPAKSAAVGIFVPLEAATNLLDLWLIKYSHTCDDGEEAAAWQQLKEALHPSNPDTSTP